MAFMQSTGSSLVLSNLSLLSKENFRFRNKQREDHHCQIKRLFFLRSRQIHSSTKAPERKRAGKRNW